MNAIASGEYAVVPEGIEPAGTVHAQLTEPRPRFPCSAEYSSEKYRRDYRMSPRFAESLTGETRPLTPGRITGGDRWSSAEGFPALSDRRWSASRHRVPTTSSCGAEDRLYPTRGSRPVLQLDADETGQPPNHCARLAEAPGEAGGATLPGSGSHRLRPAGSRPQGGRLSQSAELPTSCPPCVSV